MFRMNEKKLCNCKIKNFTIKLVTYVTIVSGNGDFLFVSCKRTLHYVALYMYKRLHFYWRYKQNTILKMYIPYNIIVIYFFIKDLIKP